MKGPGIRLDLDMRRVWECPQCRNRRRAGGGVVSMRCECTRDGAVMQLVEDRPPRRSFSEVIQRVQQASAARDEQNSARMAKERPADEQPQASAAPADSGPPAEDTGSA